MTSPFLRKAETGVKSARMLLDAGDTGGACSRAYYAMYGAARACLAWAEVEPVSGEFETHYGLITAFSMHLLKPGHFSAEIGRTLQNLQAVRHLADYEVAPVSQEKAEQAVVAADVFVATAASVTGNPFRQP